jgi:hypothetical protein
MRLEQCGEPRSGGISLTRISPLRRATAHNDAWKSRESKLNDTPAVHDDGWGRLSPGALAPRSAIPCPGQFRRSRQKANRSSGPTLTEKIRFRLEIQSNEMEASGSEATSGDGTSSRRERMKFIAWFITREDIATPSSPSHPSFSQSAATARTSQMTAVLSADSLIPSTRAHRALPLTRDREPDAEFYPGRT